jgi:hypothetical protein
MEFLDETHITRWASVCVFSNLLLILLAIGSGVLEPALASPELPLVLPQTLLVVPLLLQLGCLAVFTFSARSGALQLFKYQLQIPFLGRWMLPAFVIALSMICLGTLSRGLVSSIHQDFETFFITITTAQLALHVFHLLNLTWGFIHYLRTSRPKHYQPIQASKKSTDIKPNIRSFTGSGHLSKAYLNISEGKSRPRSEAVRTQDIPSRIGLNTQANGSLEFDPSNDPSQVQVIKR